MTEAHVTFFCCATCGVELTDFLTWLPLYQVQLEMNFPALPSGRYAVLDTPWTYRDFVTGGKTGFSYVSDEGDIICFDSGDYVLNIKDVRHLLGMGATYGCCGLQPRAELNATCVNGHPIGTIHSDCWAALIFRLGRGHVRSFSLD
jgi:hypothetical protein